MEIAPKIVAAHREAAGASDETNAKVFGLLAAAARTSADGRLNFATAQEYLAKMLEATTGKPGATYTVRSWFTEWLRDKEKSRSRGTHTRYSGVVKDFLAFLGEDADKPLLTLQPKAIRDFLDRELAAGKSRATVNNGLRNLRVGLTKAVRTQVILRSPADPIEFFTEDRPAEKGTFAPEDLRRLLAAADGDWKGVILFGAFTGANLRDITAMRWDQIDLAAGTLRYSRRKTGRQVILPLHPDLADWLLSQPAPDDGKAFVFPALAGKETRGWNGLSENFGRVMKKAGLVAEATAPSESATGERTKGRARNSLSFHSLRHSFNSAMANAGVSQELRQKLTGHASAAMNAHYTHLELAPLRAAIETLPSLAQSPEDSPKCPPLNEL